MSRAMPRLESLPLQRLLVSVIVSIISLSVVLFKFFENVTWLDSVYFVIVTISTVGYGDVTAKEDITKVVAIILIITGIISIALASQLILDKVIQYQLTNRITLPKEPLKLENHIIIAGYGSKGRRVAQLLSERRLKVVIVELDEDRVKLAEFRGFQLIQGDITKPAVLQILSLEKSMGLFLLLHNDNLTIQAGIVARSYSESLDIYAELQSSQIYKIASYAGINKGISEANFLTNVVQEKLTHSEVELLVSRKDLIAQESSIGYVQIHEEGDLSKRFQSAIPVGHFSDDLNELYLHHSLTNGNPSFNLEANHFIYAIDREELQVKIKTETVTQIPHKRVIFAGVSELTENLMKRLDLALDQMLILWDDLDDIVAADEINCKKVKWKLEDADKILSEIVEDGDLIICSFKDITHSLLLTVTLKNLDRKTNLILIVPYSYDIEPFVKVGAEVVITPQQVIPKALFSIFLRENQFAPSLVFTNGHLYEEVVVQGDYFNFKKIKNLKNEGLNVLYAKRLGDSQYTIASYNFKTKPGDRLIIWAKHEY